MKLFIMALGTLLISFSALAENTIFDTGNTSIAPPKTLNTPAPVKGTGMETGTASGTGASDTQAKERKGNQTPLPKSFMNPTGAPVGWQGI